MAGPLDVWGAYSEIGKADVAARAYEDMKKYSARLEVERNWILGYDREIWLNSGLEISDEERQGIQAKQDELTSSLDELNRKLYDATMHREESLRTAAKLEARVEFERSIYNKYAGGYGVDKGGLLQDAGKTIQGVPSFFD